MPGVPDYRDTPTPTPHRIPRALETGKLDPGWLPGGGGGSSVTSAQFAGEVSARIAGDDALSNAISALALDDLVDVSAPAPNDADVLVWNSAQSQWLASAMAGGSGSVTSADFVSLRSDVGRISVALSGAISAIAANSAQMTSADNAISAAAAAVSTRLDSTNTVVSNQGSAIVANSAQMTSADNALSAAINAVSVNLVSLRSDVGRISVALSGAISAIAANSAQMTSADNAISAAAAAVSARLDSTNTVVSNQGSAIVANSAQMTSADNAISAAAAAVSVRLNSTNTVVSNQGSAIVANSAQMTSADNAISAAAAAVASNLVSLRSDVGRLSLSVSALNSAVNAVSNRLSTWTLDNLANVSVPSPTDQQALVFNSAAGQWLASSIAGGAGSVTSSELSHVASIASAAASNVVSLASDVGRISTLVAAGLVSAGPVKIILAGDQTVTATAPTSLSGFSFATSVSATYSFEIGVICQQPLSSQGLKLVLSLNTLDSFMAQCINPAAAQANVTTVLRNTNMTAAWVTISVLTGNTLVQARGAFKTLTTNFRVKVGTNLTATGVSAITIRAGSYGYLWRMGTS